MERPKEKGMSSNLFNNTFHLIVFSERDLLQPPVLISHRISFSYFSLIK